MNPAPHLGWWWAWAAGLPAMAAGAVGVVVPVIPGPPLIILGFALVDWLSPHIDLSWGFYAGELLLGMAIYGLDALIPAAAVRRARGSAWAVRGAALGSLAVLFMGPLGLIVGPMAGAAVGELLSGGEVKQALLSGAGGAWGVAAATGAKLLLLAAMLIWFAAAV